MFLAQTNPLGFVDQLIASFEALGAAIGNFLPRLIVALLLLVVGNWIAKWVSNLTVKALDKVGADTLMQRSGLEGVLQQSGTSGLKLIGTVLWFLIFVIFLQIAAEVLDITQITQLLNGLIAYLPLVVVALLVVFIAAAIANWAGRLVQPMAEARELGWITTVVRWSILVVGILAALDTLNFAPSVTAKIENTLLQYLPLSVLVAATIAFGIGGIDTAKKWWAKLAPDAKGLGVTSTRTDTTAADAPATGTEPTIPGDQ